MKKIVSGALAALFAIGVAAGPALALNVSADRLLTSGAGTPVLSACGTTPSITGTDMAGIVTMGTTATGCVITFSTPYGTVPFCVVTWIATPLASQSYTTTAAAITLTQTSTSNNRVQYVCVGNSQ